MSLDIHSISFLDGGAPVRTDRVIAAFYPGVATPAGSGAGASVAVPFVLNVSTAYSVQVTPSQDAVPFVTKTATGFTVTLNPRLAANTLPAGTIDVVVLA